MSNVLTPVAERTVALAARRGDWLAWLPQARPEYLDRAEAALGRAEAALTACDEAADLARLRSLCDSAVGYVAGVRAQALRGGHDDPRLVARTALGVRRLSPAQARAVDGIVAVVGGRVALRGTAPIATRPYRERLEARRAALVSTAVRAAYDACGYRVSASRWAGGRHETHVMIGEPAASGASSKAWSGNGKWRGTDSAHTLRVPADWRRAVLARGLAVVGGMLTLDARLIEPDPAEAGYPGYEVYGATWVVQGRGVDLRAESGLLVRDLEMDEVIHATTLRGAQVGLARRYEAQRRAADPEVARVARAADAERKAAREAARWARYGDVEVTEADSWSVGNCETGTRDWIERHAPGRSSATVGELLALAEACGDRATYVRAACDAAIRRVQAEQRAQRVQATEATAAP